MRRTNTIQQLVPLLLILLLVNALVAVAQQGGEAGVTYEVRNDDETLAGVAERFEKPVDCIEAANDLQPEADLSTGQVLFIPDDCSAFLDAGGGGGETFLATPTPESMIATPTPRPATATPTPAAIRDQTYVVVAGDRLSRIAERFGTTVQCIARANRIANPDLIFIGQRLLISASCQAGGGGDDITADSVSVGRTCQFDRYPGRTAPGGVYTVRAGDTLDFIACDFGISLQCLRESNPQVVNSKRLMVGDELTINLGCPPWDGAVIPSR